MGGSEVLDALEELVKRDSSLAVDLQAVGDLLATVAVVRERAGETAAALAALPEEQDRLVKLRAEAQADLAEIERELAQAAARLDKLERERRPNERELALARSQEHTERERRDDGKARVTRMDAELSGLGRRREQLEAESTELVREAHATHDAIERTPYVPAAGTPSSPPDTVESVEEWGSHARASLTVARGRLQVERERVIADAERIATSVLGESPAGLSVGLLRQHVAEALA